MHFAKVSVDCITSLENTIDIVDFIESSFRTQTIEGNSYINLLEIAKFTECIMLKGKYSSIEDDVTHFKIMESIDSFFKFNSWDSENNSFIVPVNDLTKISNLE